MWQDPGFLSTNGGLQRRVRGVLPEGGVALYWGTPYGHGHLGWRPWLTLCEAPLMFSPSRLPCPTLSVHRQAPHLSLWRHKWGALDPMAAGHGDHISIQEAH